jgi:hypothetical protein
MTPTDEELWAQVRSERLDRKLERLGYLRRTRRPARTTPSAPQPEGRRIWITRPFGRITHVDGHPL